MLKEFILDVVGRREIQKTKIFLKFSAVQWLIILLAGFEGYENLGSHLVGFATKLGTFAAVVLLSINLFLPVFLVICVIIYFPFFVYKKSKEKHDQR